MPHDRHKQCLDDTIMVDTSNAVWPSPRASCTLPATMNSRRQPWQAFMFSPSPSYGSRASSHSWCKVHNTLQ
jgi:hypothetical protein